MPIERYDHYGKPRFYVTDKGTFMVRDILSENGRFSGICENCSYIHGEFHWYICKEGEEFESLRPFLPPDCVDIQTSQTHKPSLIDQEDRSI